MGVPVDWVPGVALEVARLARLDRLDLDRLDLAHYLDLDRLDLAHYLDLAHHRVRARDCHRAIHHVRTGLRGLALWEPGDLGGRVGRVGRGWGERRGHRFRRGRSGGLAPLVDCRIDPPADPLGRSAGANRKYLCLLNPRCALCG